MGYGFFDFDTQFQIMSGMFTIVFVLAIGMFLFVIVRGIGTWHKNNESPRLRVPARIAAKRISVSRHACADDHHHVGATWYYVTFEFESGDRMEFSVDGGEYGMLAENDRGMLSFQGTRYLSFERERGGA